MRSLPTLKTIAAAALLATAGSGALAQASGSFACITSNSAASCAQGASALSWTWNGSNLSIGNAAGGGYVSEVYFDLTSPMAVSFNAVLSHAGVRFLSGASPGALPGGNSYGFTSDGAFDSDRVARGGPVWGINPGEWGVFSFTNAALNSFDVGNLVAGLHVRGLVNGRSESFVTTAIPEPSTYALMLAGLGLVGFMARRRRSAV